MTELRLFSAQWCPPCKKFKKLLPALAERYPHVAIRIIDVDDETVEAECADITCLPTVKIYKEGVEQRVFTRVLAELDEIEESLDSL